jgi:hypothetical protein
MDTVEKRMKSGSDAGLQLYLLYLSRRETPRIRIPRCVLPVSLSKVPPLAGKILSDLIRSI